MSANEVDLLAANWLQRRHFWNWTEEDQVSLETWLAVSESHRIAYWRQRAGWDRSELACRFCVRPGSNSFDDKPHTRVLSFFVRFVAALVVVSALGLFGAHQFLAPSATTYKTAVGERRTIVLADGSQIELNTDTTLRASVGAAGERNLWLEKGEAFFKLNTTNRTVNSW